MTDRDDLRFDAWWDRVGKHHNPFDLRGAFKAGIKEAACGCRIGECESKPTGCRMVDEIRSGEG